MKKLLITALFGAFAVAQETTPAAAPSNHGLFYALDAVDKLNGKQLKAEHQLQYIYSFADGYKLKGVVLFQTNANKDDNGDFQRDLHNEYVQLRWVTPKFWDIVGFKTNVEARFTLPTGEGDQIAGSYGTLSPRLIMQKEFNSSFNLTVIPKLALFGQRNGNRVRADGDTSGKTSDRNPLVGLALEVLPQYKFSDNLTLTYDVEVKGTYFGNAGNGDDNTIVTGALYQELELMYNVTSLGNLGVGAVVYNDDVVFGNHSGFDPIKGDYLWAGLRVQKAFEL